MTADPSRFIYPDWPAPANIFAACTTRQGGESRGAFASLNPASHVGDNWQTVQQNRIVISSALGLPAEPLWLNQVHGAAIAGFDKQYQEPPEADAVMTRQPNQVCVVQTADCLPLLICDSQGQELAAIHAGWRGLAQGIISKVITQFQSDARQLLVWLGPAISQRHFEVGAEVRDCFLKLSEQNEDAFVDSKTSGRYMADLYRLATHELQRHHVEQIYGGDLCSFDDSERFYSYRRDGQTGRMASLIYRKS